MKTLHTPEPWTAARRSAVVEIHAQNDMVGIFQGTLLDADEANARRIVACVNACAGMPQDDVDALTQAGGVMGLTVYADDMRQQRDQLLAAIEGVLANCPDAEGLSSAYANARAAIAAVKGGAA